MLTTSSHTLHVSVLSLGTDTGINVTALNACPCSASEKRQVISCLLSLVQDKLRKVTDGFPELHFFLQSTTFQWKRNHQLLSLTCDGTMKDTCGQDPRESSLVNCQFANLPLWHVSVVVNKQKDASFCICGLFAFSWAMRPLGMQKRSATSTLPRWGSSSFACFAAMGSNSSGNEGQLRFKGKLR